MKIKSMQGKLVECAGDIDKSDAIWADFDQYNHGYWFRNDFDSWGEAVLSIASWASDNALTLTNLTIE